MIPLSEERLGVLIERLQADLREAFTEDLRKLLALYIGASELLVEEWQPADRGALRAATVRLALECLGVRDCDIQSVKDTLSGHEPPAEATRIQ
jgi:hypothetical protein